MKKTYYYSMNSFLRAKVVHNYVLSSLCFMHFRIGIKQRLTNAVSKLIDKLKEVKEFITKVS